MVQKATQKQPETDRPIRIRRAKHGAEHAYFLAARATAQDRNLSYEARGVLFYLLSKPGDWIIRVSDIRQEGAGRDKVYRILGELEQYRYLAREFIRNAAGVITGMEYVAFELPFPEKPDTVNPYTAEPDTANTELTEDRVPENTEDQQNTEKTGSAGAAATPYDSERAALGLGKPAEGVLDALCVLLYDDLDGWKLNAWRIQRLYNEILLASFRRQRWSTCGPPMLGGSIEDFRGRDKDSNPTPAQLIEKWSIAIKYDYKGKKGKFKQTRKTTELLGKQGSGSGWGFKPAQPKK
jgi:hypothetical protein